VSIQPAVEPRGYLRAVKLYEALERESVDGEFVGSKTRVYESTGLSMKYYPHLWALLTQMGCIEQTHRGNPQQPTRIKVYDPPSLDRYEAANDTVVLTRGDSLDTLRAKVKSIEERMPSIDLNRFLYSLDTRLKEIEEWIERHG
jgi:hypothetical protein